MSRRYTAADWTHEDFALLAIVAMAVICAVGVVLWVLATGGASVVQVIGE